MLHLHYIIKSSDIIQSITNMQTQPVYHYLTCVKQRFGNGAYNSLTSNSAFAPTFKLNDWQWYGSSRLGVYNADLVSTNNDYPFHSAIKNFSAGNTSSYHYGATNVQIKDNEVFKEAYTSLYWEYDSRLGGNDRWNVDPKPNPSISPYATYAGYPVFFGDLLGHTIIGVYGKPVTYKRDENDKIIWTDNASDDIKKIGEAMFTTKKVKKHSIDGKKLRQTFI